MKLLSWISFLAIPALLVSAEADASVDASAEVTELQIETTFMPSECSVKAETNERIEVHYTGRLLSNGKIFDSSLNRGTPFGFKLGIGQVIRGWDEGVTGMCLNEKRTLKIPPSKAYGARGFGSVIPPNSALVFDVELVKVEKADHPKDEL